MKKSADIIARKINDIHLLLPMRATQGGHCAYELNEVGAFLWARLDQETKVDALVDSVCQEFQIEAVNARTDVENFLREMRAEGLLE